MNDHYYHQPPLVSFLRHSSLQPKRKTLLFLHGIGDSSLSYLPLLHTDTLSDFNILLPDWLGHGKSSVSPDYHFKTQTQLLIDHIKALEQEQHFTFEEIILIPHSMAGIHAMLLCESPLQKQIKGIINIEGSITQYGSFIANKVARVIKRHQFEPWFQEFKEVMILKEYIGRFPVCRDYYTSLCLCQPQAFLQNALEIHHVCFEKTGRYTNSAGAKFAALQLPKVYVYGDGGLCQESLAFLQATHIPTKAFHTPNHFVMLACFEDVTHFIKEWVKVL